MKIRARQFCRFLFALWCIPVLSTRGQSVHPSHTSVYVLINQVEHQRAVVTSLVWQDQVHDKPVAASQVSANTGNTFPIPSSSALGFAALAIDPRTGTCYYARRSPLDASIWSVNRKGEHQLIANGLRGSYITKMAFGPDGFVYALTVESAETAAGTGRQSRLLRIDTRAQKTIPSAQVIGVLDAGSGFSPEKVFSGDMAIAANGDIYVFGSEWDPAWNYYRQGHVFRIVNPGLHRSASQPLQTEYLGLIRGMEASGSSDSTIINGVAFAADGSFLLSACDKGSGSRTYFYQGVLRAGDTRVRPVTVDPLPAGWAAADLASPFFPRLPARWPKFTTAPHTPEREAEPAWHATVSLQTSTFR